MTWYVQHPIKIARRTLFNVHRFNEINIWYHLILKSFGSDSDPHFLLQIDVVIQSKRANRLKKQSLCVYQEVNKYFMEDSFRTSKAWQELLIFTVLNFIHLFIKTLMKYYFFFWDLKIFVLFSTLWFSFDLVPLQTKWNKCLHLKRTKKRTQTTVTHLCKKRSKASKDYYHHHIINEVTVYKDLLYSFKNYCL